MHPQTRLFQQPPGECLLIHLILAMDTATGDIRAAEVTSSDKVHSPILPHLPDQIPPDEPIDTVTGYGAYGTRRCHAAILESVPKGSYPSAGTGDDDARTALPPKLATTSSKPYNAWMGSLETLVRISDLKLDRGKDEVPEIVRGTHRLTRFGLPDS